MRFATPIWRVVGSAGSWLLFAFCFTLLYLGSMLVMGLGGYCASGGPYQIETECPEAVVATVPLSIFGGLAAVGIGAFLTRGFGTPLISWAWPTLFIGLGIAFLIASAQPGGITFLILGLMFVVMGAGPLVLEFRAGARSLFLGTTNVAGDRFAGDDTGRRSLFATVGRRTRPDSEHTVAPTIGDWTLALGLWIVSAGVGIYLATLLHASFGP